MTKKSSNGGDILGRARCENPGPHNGGRSCMLGAVRYVTAEPERSGLENLVDLGRTQTRRRKPVSHLVGMQKEIEEHVHHLICWRPFAVGSSQPVPLTIYSLPLLHPRVSLSMSGEHTFLLCLLQAILRAVCSSRMSRTVYRFIPRRSLRNNLLAPQQLRPLAWRWTFGFATFFTVGPAAVSDQDSSQTAE